MSLSHHPSLLLRTTSFGVRVSLQWCGGDSSLPVAMRNLVLLSDRRVGVASGASAVVSTTAGSAARTLYCLSSDGTLTAVNTRDNTVRVRVRVRVCVRVGVAVVVCTSPLPCGGVCARGRWGVGGHLGGLVAGGVLCSRYGCVACVCWAVAGDRGWRRCCGTLSCSAKRRTAG